MWSADQKVDITGQNGQTYVGVLDPLTGSLDTTLLTEFNHDMFCPGAYDLYTVVDLLTHSHLVVVLTTTATTYLGDGRLMISGGANNYKTTLYQLAADTWEAGPEHILPRGYHVGILRADGSVFVLGGSWQFLDSVGGRDGALWRPETNAWELLPNIKAEPMQTADALGPYRSGTSLGMVMVIALLSLNFVYCLPFSLCNLFLPDNHMWYVVGDSRPIRFLSHALSPLGSMNPRTVAYSTLDPRNKCTGLT